MIDWLVLSARLLVGAVFLMASIIKLLNPRAFVQNVLNYHLLPTPLAKAYGFLLPLLEFGSALLLFSGLFTR